MSDVAGRNWQRLTSAEAAQWAARDPVLVLPVGAMEQHGPHLPLSTDVDIGMGLLEEAWTHLPHDFPAFALPAQAVGASEEHEDFAGTLSMSPQTLMRTIQGIGTGLARTGIRRLVLHNSHGGNRHAIDAAGLWLRRHQDLLVVKASYPRFERPDTIEIPASEWRHGLHGGAIETAMMLHLHPDRVRADAVADFPSLGVELEADLRRLGPEGEASFAWLSQDLNPTGAVGNAALATPELGRTLVQHYGRMLADVIRDARDFPLERLARGADTT